MNKPKIRAELKPYLYFGTTLCAVILFYKVVGNFDLLMDDLRRGLGFLMELCSPLFWGGVIFYFLRRPVIALDKVLLKNRFFKRHVKFSRVTSIILVHILLLLLLCVILLLILPQIWESLKLIAQKIPDYIGEFEEFIQKLHLEEYMDLFVQEENISRSTDKIAGSLGFEEIISNFLGKSNLSVQDTVVYLIDRVVKVGGKLVDFGLAIFLSIYLLLDAEVISRQIVTWVKSVLSKNTYYKWSKTLALVDETFYKFFIGRIYCSILVALFVFVGLLFLKIPHSALISLIIAMTNIIPYFGPFFGGAVGILITLLNAPSKAIWVLAIVILAQQVEENLLEPKILGDQIGLKPFWIMISVIIGGELFGLWGVFLAVPTFAVLKVIIVQWMTQRNT